MNTLTYGIVHCSGVDAGKFLQGQLSADILSLTDTQGALACYLNLKGRVVALMFVVKRADGFWLIMPQDIIPTFSQKLQKVIVFSKATVFDISKDYKIEGELSAPETCTEYYVRTDEKAVTFYIQPQRGIALRILKEPGPAPLPDEFLKALMDARIPWIGLEQSEKFLPHYINLIPLHAVSFDKGCFVGQEIVARMHYRGHLNKQLEVLSLPPGTLPEESEGEIVNVLDYWDERLYLMSVVL